jgi:multidrug efflux pump subunit AcrB
MGKRNSSNNIISSFRIVILFTAIILCVFIVVPKLNVNLIPEKESQTLLVSFSLPNNSPDIVEQQATSLLENGLSQLSQLKKIVSVSRYNSGYVELQFDKTADIQFKQFEIALLLRQLYPKLPISTSYPLIAVADHAGKRGNSPLLTFSIYAPEQPLQIKKNAEDAFKQAIDNISGIQKAYFSGVNNLQFAIRYNMDKCHVWHVDPGVIGNTLKMFFKNVYPGTVATEKGEQLFLKIPAATASINILENLLLVNDKGNPIRLKDLASVVIEEKEAEAYFRISDKNSVAFHVWSKDGENKILLGRKIKSAIEEAKKLLPAGYETHILYDDTEFLEIEINKNYRRIGLSISILLIFILITYRNWRILVILFATLLVNILFAIILTYFFNVPIHLYTIAGLCVAFGIIIDNAIVMLDYYHQYRNRSVFTALLGATTTTIAALSLIFFLPDEEKSVLADFSLAIIFSLIASMLVTLGFIPGLYDMFFFKRSTEIVASIKRHSRNNIGRLRRIICLRTVYYAVISFLSQYRKTLITAMILLFGLPVFYLPAKWEGHNWYHDCYNSTIGSDHYQDNIRPYVDKWFGGALRLFMRDVYDESGFRSPEQTRLYINAELPIGNTPEYVNYILGDFEKYLSGVEGVEKFITHVYSGQYGSIEVTFKDDYENTTLPYQLKSRIVARSLDWAGVDWIIHGIGQGFNNITNEELSKFRVIMKGYNYDDLQLQVVKLADKLLKNKRIQKVNTNERINDDDKNSLEYSLSLNQPGMAAVATNKFEIFGKITQFSKPVRPTGILLIDNYTYPVVIKEDQSASFSNFQLVNNILSLDSGKQVRIRDLGQIELRKMSSTIRKENRQYIQMIGFEYMGAVQYGSNYLDQVLEQMKDELPVGYEAKRERFKGNWDKKEQEKYFLLFILAVAHFIICSILFENLKQSFYIIAITPFSFIGLFLFFILGDYYFDQGGYASFVMLSGLVVNAGIFIVNDFNKLKKAKPVILQNKLLIKATINRSRTITLTVLATCCSFIPFLIDGPDEVLWFPLAIGTIGGLVFSLFVLFFMLPVFLWEKQINKG